MPAETSASNILVMPTIDNQLDIDQEEELCYPEGGLQAWLVVFGAWCAMVPCMGLLNSMGVIHSWVAENQLEHLPESTIGWIFSAYTFFLYIGGAQVGSIFDRYGARPLVIPGSIGMIASIMCMSVSKEFYQFLLSFGVLGGISASLLFTPSISTIGHWFCKRRALATGIAYTAGGLGGIAFAFMILNLAPAIGFTWTIRIIGFISTGACIAACFLLNTRIPPKHNAHTAIDLKALLDLPYSATVLSIFLIDFAIFIPLTYISSYAIAVGLPVKRSYRLIAFLNMGSVPGRALPGYLADAFGRFNVMTVTTAMCSIFILALWLPAGASESAITAFAVLFGFWSGTAISLTPVCLAQICQIEDYGKRNGTSLSVISLATLIGIPIAGALISAGGGSYSGLILFGGALYAVGAAAFLITRIIAGPKDWKAVF